MVGLVLQLGLPTRAWSLARAARAGGRPGLGVLSMGLAAVALVLQALLLAALLLGVPALFASTGG